MKNPMISVIMPVYNGAKYLNEAIDSVITQTYIDFEFIIINDGSIDHSFEIIEKYSKEDDRIIVINRENKGLSASLNEGIERSKGKYIARMDADDISINSRLEIELCEMQAKNLDVLGSHYILIDDRGRKLNTVFMPVKEELIVLHFLNTVPIAHPVAMINKEFLLQHNLKYEDMPAEDYHLWSKMYNLGAKFSNCDEFLLLYRKNINSFSSTKRLEMKKDRKNIINKFCKNNHNAILEAINVILMKKEEYTNYEREIISKALLYLIFKQYNFSYLRKFSYFFNKADTLKCASYLKSLI